MVRDKEGVKGFWWRTELEDEIWKINEEIKMIGRGLKGTPDHWAEEANGADVGAKIFVTQEYSVASFPP